MKLGDTITIETYFINNPHVKEPVVTVVFEVFGSAVEVDYWVEIDDHDLFHERQLSDEQKQYIIALTRLYVLTAFTNRGSKEKV